MTFMNAEYTMKGAILKGFEKAHSGIFLLSCLFLFLFEQDPSSMEKAINNLGGITPYFFGVFLVTSVIVYVVSFINILVEKIADIHNRIYDENNEVNIFTVDFWANNLNPKIYVHITSFGLSMMYSCLFYILYVISS